MKKVLFVILVGLLFTTKAVEAQSIDASKGIEKPTKEEPVKLSCSRLKSIAALSLSTLGLQ